MSIITEAYQDVTRLRKHCGLPPVSLEDFATGFSKYQSSNLPTGKGSNGKFVSSPVCKRGHKRTPENTYVDKSGKRNCQLCTKERKLNKKNK